MKKSLILLEFKNISTGFFVLDEITKNFNANMEILKLLCPGRYMIICSGNQGEMESLRKHINEIRKNEKHKHITDRLVSGVDEELMKKINKSIKFSDSVKSLGILEFSNTVQAIETADFIEDESPVEILTIKIGLGMCNKGIIIFVGDTSDVINVIDRIEKIELKELISSEVINSPNKEFLKNFHF